MDQQASSSHSNRDSKFHLVSEPSFRCTFLLWHNLGARAGCAWQGDNDGRTCSGMAQRPHATDVSLEKLLAGETLKRDA